MKNQLLLIMVVSVFFACGKKKDCCGAEELVNTGKYVGVMVGSSGYYELDFVPGNPKAIVHFDGEVYTLPCHITIEPATDYHDILFGDASSVHLRFSIDMDGKKPVISFFIPGHSIQATIDKTNDKNRIELYEGTSYATTGADGEFFINYIYNLRLNYEDNTFTILSKVTASNTNPVGETEEIKGTFTKSGNTIAFRFNGGSVSGNIVGNQIKHQEPGFSFDFVKVF